MANNPSSTRTRNWYQNLVPETLLVCHTFRTRFFLVDCGTRNLDGLTQMHLCHWLLSFSTFCTYKILIDLLLFITIKSSVQLLRCGKHLIQIQVSIFSFDIDNIIYVAAKATYIRLLYGKRGFFGPSSVKWVGPI